MSVNLHLLNATLDIIQKNPELHGQETWVSRSEYTACGTTMCFAGHAAVLAGAEIPDPKKHDIHDWYVGKDEKNSYLNIYQVNRVGYANYKHVRDFAGNALGLDYQDCEYLFDANRTREEIELAVQELNEHGTILTKESDEEYEDDDYDYPCSCGCEDDYGSEYD